jgi:hypothetical protein
MSAPDFKKTTRRCIGTLEGLAGIKKESASFTHAILIEDISYNSLCFLQNRMANSPEDQTSRANPRTGPRNKLPRVFVERVFYVAQGRETAMRHPPLANSRKGRRIPLLARSPGASGKFGGSPRRQKALLVYYRVQALLRFD